MVGVYFSGTGNTKYYIEKFLKALNGEAQALPIEDPATANAVKNDKNIQVEGGKVTFNGKCTMCYRCFSNCPQKAITIIGKQVYEQSKIEKYVDGGKF